MSEYVSNATMDDLAARVVEAGRILVTSHTKPDGDALGSCLALHRALTPRGKVVEIHLGGPIEPCLHAVAGSTPYSLLEDKPPTDDFDLAIVVDTGAWSQLGPIEPWLRRHHERVIGLDHHRHGDPAASLRIVDSSCAAAVQLVLRLLDTLAYEITDGSGGVAEALFVGLATDTGWFRYDNADAEAFAVAARLLACDVDKSALYQLIEETHRPERLALEARALASLEFAAGGGVAVMSLSAGDFGATGGTLSDLTSMVNAPMIVGAVRASVLLAELDGGVTKMSFRSKPTGPGFDTFIDVNELAGRFGGGGHVHAAGARSEKGLQETREEVMKLMAGS